MIIGTTTIGGNSTHTLGLDIITKEINKAGYKTVVVNEKNAKEVDILLVSLYWIAQLLEYPKFLMRAKININERKPIVIVGGSVVLNPNPIKDMFHYAVIGDGENVTLKLIKAIENRECPDGMNHVLSNSNIKKEVYTNVCKELKADHYIENRTNKITRIEIARGCKYNCKFCQLTHTKPYREIPPVLLKNLIATAPTKNIALFAPDRGSYSGFQKVENWCLKYGKRNMGTDIRLSSLKNIETISSIRFGVEGFSEKDRVWLGKPYKHQKIVDDFCDIIKKIKTPKGKDVTVVTWYMIIGTPNQGVEDYKEFSRLLQDIGKRINKRKLTIFLTLNDFTTPPHTPIENEKKDIFTDHYKMWMNERPNIEGITIAQHGGSRTPTMRLFQSLAFRGGENSNKAIYNISKNKSILKNKNGIALLTYLKRIGVDTNSIINGYKNETPWNNIKITK